MAFDSMRTLLTALVVSYLESGDRLLLSTVMAISHVEHVFSDRTKTLPAPIMPLMKSKHTTLLLSGTTLICSLPSTLRKGRRRKQIS